MEVLDPQDRKVQQAFQVELATLGLSVVRALRVRLDQLVSKVCPEVRVLWVQEVPRATQDQEDFQVVSDYKDFQVRLVHQEHLDRLAFLVVLDYLEQLDSLASVFTSSKPFFFDKQVYT